MRFHTTNQEEAEAVKQEVSAKVEVRIMPNLPSVVNEWQPREKHVGLLQLVSLARISLEKNVLGALEILSACVCPIRLDWYGQLHNDSYEEKCRRYVQQLPAHIAVFFHGGITPSEISEALQKADFFFLPPQGENYGHNIVEALLAGSPVIICDKTPWRGLQALGVGWDLSVENLRLFSETLQQAYEMDHEEYQHMSSTAATYAREQALDPELLRSMHRMFEYD